MSTTREFHNIALVGFMGAGKSSVGQILAHVLHFKFFDTDAQIEQNERSVVSEIFAKQGEARFRELESESVRGLESAKGLIISTGGGLVMNPDNLASLKKHALVVCLWASPETIYNRVKNQTHRPLLQCADPLSRIREMIAARTPAYRQADVLVSSDYRSPRDVALHVASQFRSLVKPAPAPPQA